ncbi:MAG: hypothetical protein K6347_00885 [Campylobacterales bacterium]
MVNIDEEHYLKTGEIIIDANTTDHRRSHRPTPIRFGRFEMVLYLILTAIALLMTGQAIEGIEMGALWFFWFAIIWRGLILIIVLLLILGLNAATSLFAPLRFFIASLPLTLLVLSVLLPLVIVPLGAWLIAYANGDFAQIIAGTIVLLLAWSGALKRVLRRISQQNCDRIPRTWERTSI